MTINELIRTTNEWVLGWPIVIFVLAVGILYTIVLKGIQIRYFLSAWRATLSPDASSRTASAGDMSPLQAFVNTLNSNLGNGSIAGMATAIYIGGPGAALWVVIAGILLMAVRFAEVYISTHYGAQSPVQTTLGGPMLYLKYVPAGKLLSYLYAICTLLFGCIMGNAVQANSIGLSITTTWGVAPWVNAWVLLVLVFYILLGGAARIIKVSDKIVPLKVFVFFASACIVLAYHAMALPQALKLIVTSAFQPLAVAGGLIGFSLIQTIRAGIFYSIMASESGLGSAAIIFGFTGSRDPVTSGFLGMISAFVSTLVCFMVALCIVASGVWDSGLTSTALTIKAFDTVFHGVGGWIVSFLSVTFGIGVLITYAYVTRAAWLFLTNGRISLLFIPLYCVCTFLGAQAKVDIVWDIATLTNAGMLVINLFGIMWLLPMVYRGVANLDRKKN